MVPVRFRTSSGRSRHARLLRLTIFSDVAKAPTRPTFAHRRPDPRRALEHRPSENSSKSKVSFGRWRRWPRSVCVALPVPAAIANDSTIRDVPRVQDLGASAHFDIACVEVGDMAVLIVTKFRPRGLQRRAHPRGSGQLLVLSSRASLARISSCSARWRARRMCGFWIAADRNRRSSLSASTTSSVMCGARAAEHAGPIFARPSRLVEVSSRRARTRNRRWSRRSAGMYSALEDEIWTRPRSRPGIDGRDDADEDLLIRLHVLLDSFSTGRGPLAGERDVELPAFSSNRLGSSRHIPRPRCASSRGRRRRLWIPMRSRSSAENRDRARLFRSMSC